MSLSIKISGCSIHEVMYYPPPKVLWHSISKSSEPTKQTNHKSLEKGFLLPTDVVKTRENSSRGVKVRVKPQKLVNAEELRIPTALLHVELTV